MKIAVAADGNSVSEHFGYCGSFVIITAEDGAVAKRETVENPGHKPGFLPEFLSGMGVNAVIAGGMGGNAVRLFGEKGIKVVTGASGPIDKAVDDYLGGRLESSGSACREHMHSDECGGHEH
jgi:predicted Fe-Mo cluster-binding NifX family protein